jgi:putative membrane protein
MWWSDYWPMPWMFFGPLMMLIFFFVCLAAIGMMSSGRGGHALEILKERYARGEINKSEFEERRHLLEA